MSTERGAATSTGIRNASKGTATNDSPNPNADRIKVAKKMTIKTYMVMEMVTTRF
jgi:hypothetical protein